MLPVGHAAVGILTYAGVQLPREWTEFGAISVVAALLGSQFPDAVDKPLAYYQLLPSGRSLGHSVVFLLVVGLVLYQLTPENHRNNALAFWVAAVSHPLADARHALLTLGRSDLPGYLLWPMTPVPTYGNPAAPWVRIVRIYSDPEFSIVTLALVTCVCAVVVSRVAIALSEESVEWGHPLGDWY